MAPKQPFTVHSLSKHIEETKKGLSAGAQSNQASIKSTTPAIKREFGSVDKAIFGSNGHGGDGDDDDDEETSSSDDSSSSSDDDDDDDGGASAFLRKLTAPVGQATTNGSDKKKAKVEPPSAGKKQAETNSVKKPVAVKPEPISSDDSSSSDSESDEKDVKSPKGAALATKPAASTTSSSGSTSDANSSSGSGSDSSSDSGSKQKAKGKQPQDKQSGGKAKSTPIAKAAQDSDSTSETESSGSEEESSSEEESKVNAKGPPPTVKTAIKSSAKPSTITQANGSTSSSDESESSDEDERPTKKPARAAPRQAELKTASSGSDSETSSQQNVDESIHIEDRDQNGIVTASNSISPDFVLRKGEAGPNGKDVARICSQANMQGKQFWYFTVPASVPISVVQSMEIPLDQAQAGQPVFSHNGEDYGVSFASMTPKSSIQILIPSADGPQYQPAAQPIDQFMQIRRITQLNADSDKLEVGPSERRPPRPQPKGLKARYKPIGVKGPMGTIGAGSLDEDDEMAEAPALPSPVQQQRPGKGRQKDEEEATKKAKKSEKKKEKKKQKENEAARTGLTGAKGDKGTEVSGKGKRKHTSSEDEAAAAAEQLMAESQTAAARSKKPRTMTSGSLKAQPGLSASQPSPSGIKKQTPVVPPTVPTQNLETRPDGVTAKKASNSKEKTVTPLRPSAVAPGSGSRQTIVPIPPIPGFGKTANDLAPTATPKAASASQGRTKTKEVKEKTKKAKSGSLVQQQSPSSSAPVSRMTKSTKPIPPPWSSNPA